jgi:hypothetical protein
MHGGGCTADKEQMMHNDDNKSRSQHAYETLLEHVEEFIGSEKHTLTEALHKAQERLHALGDLTREEIDDISSEFVKDLREVGEEAHEVGEFVGNALKMDAMYITDSILERLRSVADQTSLELMQLNEELARRIREREQQQQQQGGSGGERQDV